MASLGITNRDLFIPMIAATSFLSWIFTICSRSNAVVDSLPIIAFLLQLGFVPWRQDVTDLEVLLLFFSASIAAMHSSIRAIRNWDSRDPRVRIWWTGLAGEAVCILAYFYTNGAGIIPVIPENWTDGARRFEIAKVQVGMETLKCICLVLSLVDFGYLPRKFWKTALIKAAQIAFPWFLYEIWDVSKPGSEDAHAIMTVVWAALQKSKALELVIVLRTISVVFNWTACVPPVLQPGDDYGSPLPHSLPVTNPISDHRVERRGNSSRHRLSSVDVPGSIPIPRQQFPLYGLQVHDIRPHLRQQVPLPVAEPTELSIEHSVGQGPVTSPVRLVVATVSLGLRAFARQVDSRR